MHYPMRVMNLNLWSHSVEYYFRKHPPAGEHWTFSRPVFSYITRRSRLEATPAHLYVWSLGAVSVRVCSHVAVAALHLLPRTHPARTYYLGRVAGFAELAVHPLYAGLPTWAIQAARATLLLLAAALLWSYIFGLPNFPGIFDWDTDPILHRHLPHTSANYP